MIRPAAGLVLAGALALGAPAFAAEVVRSKATFLKQEDISDVPGRQFIMLYNDFAPGAVSPPHRHPGDQWTIVQAGELWISVNGEPEKAHKVGDILHIPAGVPHTAVNRTQAPARALEMIVVEKGKPVLQPIPAG